MKWVTEVNGRSLDLTPINTGPVMMKFQHEKGVPYRVVLEPGDATRYEVIIVPLRGAAKPDAYDPMGDLVMVASLNLAMKGPPPVVDLRWPPGAWDFTDSFTGYTAEVLASLFGWIHQLLKGEL